MKRVSEPFVVRGKKAMAQLKYPRARLRARTPLPGMLLTALAIVGCGGPPTATESARPARVLPAPSVPTSGETSPETTHLARLATALNTMTYMEGMIAFQEFEGTREEHGEAKFSFRRSPFAARVDIEESNRMLAAGSSVLWTGGDKVWVKRKGIPVTLSFPYDHSLVTSIRGYRLDQTDIFSMGKVLLAPGAKVRLLGKQKVEDRERFMFEVTSPASLPGVTRERIGVDVAMYVPTYREIYAGSRLIHRGIGRNLQINRKLDDARFNL